MPGLFVPAVRRARRHALAAAAALATAAGLSACADYGLLLDAAFPSEVPGLPPSEPWFSLPVGAWLTESRIAARAISACTGPGCATEGAVGLFAAEGDDAERLARLATDPEALRRQVLDGPRARRPGTRRPVQAPTRLDVGRIEEHGFVGLRVRLAGAGGREAAGIALVRRRGAGAILLVVVAANAAGAEGIAAGVAAALR